MLFVKTVSRLDRDSIGRCFSLHFEDRYLQDSCLKNTLVTMVERTVVTKIQIAPMKTQAVPSL